MEDVGEDVLHREGHGDPADTQRTDETGDRILEVSHDRDHHDDPHADPQKELQKAVTRNGRGV